MNPEIKGTITVAFVGAGYKEETKRAWLRVSDGIEAQFLDVPTLTKEEVKDLNEKHEKGDQIDLVVVCNPLTKRTRVVEFDV
jgi:hypothetical protein